jgi:hypothetical protein
MHGNYGEQVNAHGDQKCPQSMIDIRVGGAYEEKPSGLVKYMSSRIEVAHLGASKTIWARHTKIYTSFIIIFLVSPSILLILGLCVGAVHNLNVIGVRG